MRTTKSRRVWSQLAVAAVALCAAKAAWATVSTNRPGSILIFPKVVATTTRDTIIQITNSSPMSDNLHCFYINAALNPHTGLPQWQETDFSIWLTRQQPTHFRVSTGRPVDPSDNFTTAGKSANAGLDPGVIPPVETGFTGELLCVEIDASGDPVGVNALTGSATLRSGTGDVARYNGTTIKGDNVGTDANLSLNGTEYEACPASLRFDLLADGSQDPAVQAWGNGGVCTTGGAACQLGSTDCGANGPCVAGHCSVTTSQVCGDSGDPACPSGESCNLNGSAVRNFLTFVPCNHDFDNQIPGTVTLSTMVYDEFETPLSVTPLTVTCWTSLSVTSTILGGALNNFSGTGAGEFLSAVITPQSSSGVLAVGETVVTDSNGQSASTAINPTATGSLPGAVIRISK